MAGARTGPTAAGRPMTTSSRASTGVASLMDTLTGEPRYAPTILADKTCGVMARAGDPRRAVITASAPAAASSSKCRCSRPWCRSSWSSICTAARFDPPVGTAGYSRMLAPWRRPYRTADGYVCMLIYTDAQWRRFWTAVGKPEMMNDARFKDMAARSRNIADVYRIAGEQFASRKTRRMARAVRRAGNSRPGRSIRSTTCSTIEHLARGRLLQAHVSIRPKASW